MFGVAVVRAVETAVLVLVLVLGVSSFDCCVLLLFVCGATRGVLPNFKCCENRETLISQKHYESTLRNNRALIVSSTKYFA